MKEWTKEIPGKPGWYWLRFRGKHGPTQAPARVDSWPDIHKNGRPVQFVRPASGPDFHNLNRKDQGMSGARFGPRIREPR